MTTIETILLSIKDLIKYKVTTTINTGDKVIDGLINTILITIISMIFMEDYRRKVIVYLKIVKHRVNKYLFCCKKNTGLENIKQITKENFLKFMEHLDPSIFNNHQIFQWLASDNKLFTQKLNEYLYYLTSHDTKFVLFSETKTILTYDGRTINLKNKKNIHPIFIDSKKNLIGIMQDEYGLSIYAVDVNSLHELNQFLLNGPENLTNDKNLCIYYHDENNKSIINKRKIYPDRNFKNYVSKHKQTILAHVKHFKKANELGMSSLNGFGSYNFRLFIIDLLFSS